MEGKSIFRVYGSVPPRGKATWRENKNVYVLARDAASAVKAACLHHDGFAVSSLQKITGDLGDLIAAADP